MKTRPKSRAKVAPGRKLIPASKMAVDARIQKVIEEMFKNGMDGYAAAVAVGYKPGHGATQASWRMLKRVDVKAAIAAHLKRAGEIHGLTVDRTLREVARVAYFDPLSIYNEDGSLKALHEMTPDARAAIASIKTEELATNNGEGKPPLLVMRKEVKLNDKNSALDKAMKYHGLYERDNDQMGTAVARLFDVPGKRKA